LFTERTHLSLWASAVGRAHVDGGLGIVERTVDKDTNDTEQGLLDLWMTIEEQEYEFDYAVEAKPHMIRTLVAGNQAAKVVGLAVQELSDAVNNNMGGIGRFLAGAVVGVMTRPKKSGYPAPQKANAFEAQLWAEIQSELAAGATNFHHVVFCSAFLAEHAFSKWEERVPYAGYGLFLAVKPEPDN